MQKCYASVINVLLINYLLSPDNVEAKGINGFKKD